MEDIGEWFETDFADFWTEDFADFWTEDFAGAMKPFTDWFEFVGGSIIEAFEVSGKFIAYAGEEFADWISSDFVEFWEEDFVDFWTEDIPEAATAVGDWFEQAAIDVYDGLEDAVDWIDNAGNWESAFTTISSSVQEIYQGEWE